MAVHPILIQSGVRYLLHCAEPAPCSTMLCACSAVSGIRDACFVDTPRDHVSLAARTDVNIRAATLELHFSMRLQPLVLSGDALENRLSSQKLTMQLADASGRFVLRRQRICGAVGAAWNAFQGSNSTAGPVIGVKSQGAVVAVAVVPFVTHVESFHLCCGTVAALARC